MFGFNPAANVGEASTDLTKQEFEANLINEIANSSVEESEISKAEYEKYQSLSDDKKEQLIAYLNDEELMIQITKEFFEPGKSELSKDIVTEEIELDNGRLKRSIISDDIVIEDFISDIPRIADSPIRLSQNRIAHREKDVTILGITGMRHKSSLPYAEQMLLNVFKRCDNDRRWKAAIK